MANEIQATFGLKVTSGNYIVEHSNRVIVDSIVNNPPFRSLNIQVIGTSLEALEISTDAAGGAVGGWGWFRNLGGTGYYAEADLDYVYLGLRSSGTSGAFIPFSLLSAGDIALYKTADLKLYAKTDVGTVRLEFDVISE